SSRRRHTRFSRDWSSDVCSSDLVVVGALSGAAACIALFGQVHVLTLVLGASLVGVSIDFPLHYLSKSWTLQPWNSHLALRLTLRSEERRVGNESRNEGERDNHKH